MELLVFNCLLDDIVVKSILNKDYAAAKRRLIYFAETEGITDNVFKEYIISIIVNTNNVLSEVLRGKKSVGQSLHEVVLSDLRDIFIMLSGGFDFNYIPSEYNNRYCKDYTESVKLLVNTHNEKDMLDLLIKHYTLIGSGDFSKYSAFKYNGKPEEILNTEKITFDDLIGIEYQKNILCDNTEALLEGRKANNILLFGDRGAGKSSSVKALLNKYCNSGLKIIEMPKQYIGDIPNLVKELSVNPHKYIIFLDDLSFEKKEADYHILKIAMEGQLQESPVNVLIYATSNRRHLIKETWGDREGEEIHVSDDRNDTLSLSERFGISLFFSSPSSQKDYLEIVAQMLEAYNIKMTPEIEKEAIRWQMSFGSRSARCASQFVMSYKK